MDLFPREALLAFLVTSVIAVSIPRDSSNEEPVWLITADILPRFVAICPDETAKLFAFYIRTEVANFGLNLLYIFNIFIFYFFWHFSFPTKPII